MNRVQRPKRLAKKIGIGACLIIPLTIGLSILFAELKMNNVLSVFLIVLSCGIVCFIYILI